MKDYYDKKNHRCTKSNSYIKNKRNTFCKNCIQNLVVCRYGFDANY